MTEHDPRRTGALRDERPRGAPASHPHALAEAGAVAGAVVGAVAGAIAGPAFSVAGAVVGSALGAAAGETVERAEHERGAHEADLDATIGLTGGGVGTSDANKHPSAQVLEEARLYDELKND